MNNCTTMFRDRNRGDTLQVTPKKVEANHDWYLFLIILRICDLRKFRNSFLDHFWTSF